MAADCDYSTEKLILIMASAAAGIQSGDKKTCPGVSP
jgi:hypothetical protein